MYIPRYISYNSCIIFFQKSCKIQAGYRTIQVVKISRYPSQKNPVIEFRKFCSKKYIIPLQNGFYTTSIHLYFHTTTFYAVRCVIHFCKSIQMSNRFYGLLIDQPLNTPITRSITRVFRFICQKIAIFLCFCVSNYCYYKSKIPPTLKGWKQIVYLHFFVRKSIKYQEKYKIDTFRSYLSEIFTYNFHFLFNRIGNFLKRDSHLKKIISTYIQQKEEI